MERTEVLVIGLGPVGLFLSLLLAKQGIRLICVDKKKEPARETRSIGIHPPLLDFLENINLLSEFLQYGSAITETQVYFNRRFKCSVDIGVVSSRNKYVLSIPQYETERILTQALSENPRVTICRDMTLCEISQNSETVTASFNEKNSVQANFLVGADGFRSTVREILKIPVSGSRYPDYYAMADFSPGSFLPSQASIFLGQQGLLESFPVGRNSRRWVARIGNAESPEYSREGLLQIIEQRKPKEISCGEFISTPQTFSAGNFVSSNFFSGRVALVGDAAHVVSPIGGQGMNLGWLGARELSNQLHLVLRHGKDHTLALTEYEKKLQKMAKIIRHRAEINMSFGRPGVTLGLRSNILTQLLRLPTKRMLVDSFTMGGLGEDTHRSMNFRF